MNFDNKKKTESISCNVCENPRTFNTSKEIENIYCHRRKFSDHFFTVWRCSFCDSLHSKEVVNLKVVVLLFFWLFLSLKRIYESYF